MASRVIAETATPQLGLVCITVGDEVRFKTITRTRLRALPSELQFARLRDLYTENIRRLSAALEFCRSNDIRLYRLTSSLFPQSEDGAGAEVLAEMAPLLARTGARALELGMRLVMHPDQFAVLNSESESVVRNSVTILEQHARVLDLLQQPRTGWAAIEIHGGKGKRSDELVDAIAKLPENVRTRIALENDEFAYDAAAILDICQRAGVRMVFDAHHHLCSEGLSSYDDPSVAHFVAASRTTWPDPTWQMVHISNGRDRLGDPRHADYIEVMPVAFRDVPWIEVEAKQKDLAIRRLRQEWPRKTRQSKQRVR